MTQVVPDGHAADLDMIKSPPRDEVDHHSDSGLSDSGLSDSGLSDSGLSDSGLMICIGRRCRSEAALAEVYRRHGGAMHALAAQVCGSELGENVVRDVMLALWRAPEAFDASRASLRGFLLAQAHAHAVELARQDKARRARASATMFRGGGVDSAALAGHVGDHAWSVLSAAPEHDFSAIALAYFCGYSCADLADLTGQTEQVINARMRSGLVGLGTRSPPHESTR